MLTEIAPPPVSALPMTAFAEHLRLPSGFAGQGEEAELELYLRAGIAAVEGMTGKALLSRRFLWKTTRWRRCDRAVIPIAPAVFVASVTMVTSSGAWSSVDPSAYVLKPDAFAPALAGPRGGALPPIPEDGVAEVEIEAGYGADWSAVPADLRHAAFLLAAHFHEQRHVVAMSADQAPFGVRPLIARYRQVRL